jgi:hypothetical protein
MIHGGWLALWGAGLAAKLFDEIIYILLGIVIHIHYKIYFATLIFATLDFPFSILKSYPQPVDNLPTACG